MADRATFNNPSAEDKGKGKSTDPTNEMNMDDESSSESEPEIVSLPKFSPPPWFQRFNGVLTFRASRSSPVRAPLIC